jgi:HAD superfamily hydrolase (TIGR01549 family)
MALRAISFDLFDTLVDLHMERLPEFEVDGRRLRGTQAILHDASRDFAQSSLADFVRLLGEVDREFREARYARDLELPTLERFAVLAARLGAAPGLAERLTGVHMGAIRAQARVVEHHRDVLLALARRARLGVCSNFSHAATACEILADAGLLDLLDAVVISEQTGFRKPRAEIFATALERLDAAPEETLHVGDQLAADVAGAAALGMPTGWITRRVRDREASLREHTGPAPTLELSDLRELPDLATRLG